MLPGKTPPATNAWPVAGPNVRHRMQTGRGQGPAGLPQRITGSWAPEGRTRSPLPALSRAANARRRGLRPVLGSGVGSSLCTASLQGPLAILGSWPLLQSRHVASPHLALTPTPCPSYNDDARPPDNPDTSCLKVLNVTVSAKSPLPCVATVPGSGGEGVDVQLAGHTSQEDPLSG